MTEAGLTRTEQFGKGQAPRSETARTEQAGQGQAENSGTYSGDPERAPADSLHIYS